MIKNPIILIYEFDTEGNITNHIWQKKSLSWMEGMDYFG